MQFQFSSYKVRVSREPMHYYRHTPLSLSILPQNSPVFVAYTLRLSLSLSLFLCFKLSISLEISWALPLFFSPCFTIYFLNSWYIQGFFLIESFSTVRSWFNELERLKLLREDLIWTVQFQSNSWKTFSDNFPHEKSPHILQ